MCSIQDPTWLNRLSTAGVSPGQTCMWQTGKQLSILQRIATRMSASAVQYRSALDPPSVCVCVCVCARAGSDSLVGAPVEAWENCVWHAKNLQSSVEDLGAAMYPPQPVHTSRKGKACIAVPACKGSFKPENRRSQLHSSYHDSEAVPTLLN
eukprot:scaffold11784_cov19-Tisochrysis_lutea.AAC.2